MEQSRPPQPPSPEVLEQQRQQAVGMLLQEKYFQQINFFFTSLRQLHVNIAIACMAEELPENAKNELYNEALRLAGTLAASSTPDPAETQEQ